MVSKVCVKLTVALPICLALLPTFSQASTTLPKPKLTLQLSKDLVNAAAEGDDDLVTELIKAGADVNFQPEFQSTFWDQRHLPRSEGSFGLWVAANSGNLSTVEILLKHGAKVGNDFLFSSSGTRLPSRSNKDRAQINALLIKQGADPNSTDESFFIENTPLLQAVATGEVQTVIVLLEQGANPNIPTAKGHCTPLQVAKNFGACGNIHLMSNSILWKNVIIEDPQAQAKMIQALSDHGAHE